MALPDLSLKHEIRLQLFSFTIFIVDGSTPTTQMQRTVEGRWF
jgi:hypothetical protein